MSSTIEYVCQKYVLTYCLHDKSKSIVHVDMSLAGLRRSLRNSKFVEE